MCHWKTFIPGDYFQEGKIIERAKLLLTINNREKIAAIETTEMPHEMDVLQQQVYLFCQNRLLP